MVVSFQPDAANAAAGRAEGQSGAAAETGCLVPPVCRARRQSDDLGVPAANGRGPRSRGLPVHPLRTLHRVPSRRWWNWKVA